MRKKIIFLAIALLLTVCAVCSLTSCKNNNRYGSIETYQVIFEPNIDGVEKITTSVNPGNTVSSSIADFKNDGYKLVGWFVDKECTIKFNFDDKINENTTLYACWKKEVSIIFQPSKTLKPVFKTYAEGDVITADDIKKIEDEISAEQSGLKFEGWYSDAEMTNKIDFPYTCTDSTKLYVNCNGVAIVSYIYNMETFENKTVAVNVGAAAEIPELDGYIFEGWYIDEELEGLFDSKNGIVEDITLYAKWVKSFDIIFYPCYSGGSVAKVAVPEGKPIGLSKDKFPQLSRDGYRFVDWYFDKKCEQRLDIKRIPNDKIEVYAKWIKEVEITFNQNYGFDDKKTVVYCVGDKAESYTIDREGYALEGWYKENTCQTKFDFENEILSENIELYANWKKIFTVSFDLNFVTDQKIDDIKAVDGNKADLPTPQRTGYTFSGWYNGETKYTNDTAITEDVTLTASWTINKYTVTFDANYEGAEPVDSVTVDFNSTIVIPGIERTGYTFNGWFDGETKYTNDTAITEDVTLTASWTIKKYTVTFDANYEGAQTINSATVDYNNTVVLPVVQRENYAFDGWFAGEEEFTSDTVITEDIALTAKWTINKYTVTFDANYEGAEAITSANVKYNNAVTLPNIEREGYTLKGWFDGETEYTATTPITNDVLLTAKWEINKYTVTFNPNYDGAEAVEPKTANYNETIILPVLPARKGINFVGWFDENGNEFTEETKVSKALNLTARWQNQYKVTFTTILKSDEDSTEIYVDPNGFVEALEKTPKTGYYLCGWYTDKSFVESKKFDFETTPITKDIELFAKWVEKKYYVTIDYNDVDGANDPYSVGEAEKVQEPKKKEKEGWKIEGWYTTKTCDEGTEFVFGTTIDKDITLYAKWVEICSVTFKFNVEGYNDIDLTVNKGLTASEPNSNIEGYDFKGWYTDSEYVTKYDFKQPVSANTIIYGKWEKIEYTVTFNINYVGGETITPIVVAKDATIAEIPQPANRLGYEFKGWFNDKDVEFTTTTKVTSSITLNAKWAEKKFDVVIKDGENTIYSESLQEGTSVQKPKDPAEKQGFAFKGWYVKPEGLEERVFNFDTDKVTSNINIYAKWVKVFEVKFDLCYGGKTLDTEYVEEGSYVKTPNPERDGYYFSSWHVEGTPTSAVFNTNTTPITSSMTLYAQWNSTTPTYYTVTFVDKDKQVITANTQTNVVAGSLISAPKDNPTMEDFDFVGWYTTSDCSVEYDFATMAINGNTTIYSKWEAKYKFTYMTEETGDPYKINYVSKNGKEIKISDIPEKDGFVFDGWVTEFGGKTEFDFDTVITKDTIVYAKWTEEQSETPKYTVTFLDNGGETITEYTKTNVTKGTTITEPKDNPTMEDFDFVGWYTDDTLKTEFDFATMTINSDTTIYSKWEAKYKFTYMTEETGDPYKVNYVSKNGKETKISNVPTYTDDTKVFDGWVTEFGGETEFDFDTVITKDTIVYAKWADAVKVTFLDAQGEEWTTVNVKKNGKANVPKTNPENPDKEQNYEFKGWYADKDLKTEFDFENTTIENDLNLYPKFVKVYTVTFMYGYQQELSYTEKKVSYEDGYLLTTNDIKDRNLILSQQKVIYWYLYDEQRTKTSQYDDNDIFDWEKTPITSNISLLAKWEDRTEFDVTFVVDEETSKTIQVKKGGKIVMPEDMISPTSELTTKQNLIFVNWYTDDTRTYEFNFGKEIDQDTKIYAKWAKKVAVTLDYGYDDKKDTYTGKRGEKLDIPDTPIREGYEFDCWMRDGDVYDFTDTVNTTSITLVARWKKID